MSPDAALLASSPEKEEGQGASFAVLCCCHRDAYHDDGRGDEIFCAS